MAVVYMYWIHFVYDNVLYFVFKVRNIKKYLCSFSISDNKKPFIKYFFSLFLKKYLQYIVFVKDEYSNILCNCYVTQIRNGFWCKKCV